MRRTHHSSGREERAAQFIPVRRQTVLAKQSFGRVAKEHSIRLIQS